ncbi:hypothetical protein N865_03270 [Intrasporangium oryzae NRRL B-24470]|uniref:HTH luxR-type domain-containing protein n=1 Tax=Intrasporangium oryzae NRRL B-24470 TaxID=1386089 RepID=W9G9V8_9MICO|nr:LuxR C-terminal-related transcriptional regulator [Intrasporangium oryzae]EWT02865.1 hypothetical protein N865_03270 [Intrasporangium oryzae NRRL B-24470]
MKRSARDGEPVLPSKLAVPRPAHDHIARPRLMGQLRRGVTGPLTLLSAPAGYGKTALVSSWISLSEHPGPVTWQTLDDGDARPGIFWTYALDALARSGVDVDEVGMPSTVDSVDRALLTRLSWALTRHEEPVVMVIDGSDTFVDWARRVDLAFVLRNAGANLRVVLLTRFDPSLPLHRYRLEGGMTEIRAADLAFDEAEAAQLFTRCGITLTAEQTHALVERTGGWAAGLRFAAMSLARQADVDQSIRDFTGATDNVSAYLMTEVLDAQPEDLRDVLLRTSLVDDLRPGLCDALTGRFDGTHVLPALAHGNAFVECLAGTNGVYRYQPLFRQFLRAQLAYERPDLVGDLHRSAAGWYAREGDTGQAVQHAVAGESWEEAARFLVEDLRIGAVLCDEGLASTLRGMPADTPGAAAAIVRAAIAGADEDGHRCLAELARAQVELSATADPAPSLLVSASLLEAKGASLTCDVATGLDAADRAEELLRTSCPDATRSRPDLVVLLAMSRARLSLWNGDFEHASALLVEASRVAEAPGVETLRVACIGLRALLEAIRGRLRRATRLTDEAERLARDAGLSGHHRLMAAATAQAWIETEEFHLVTARERLDEAARVRRGRDPLTADLLALVRSRLMRARGDLAGAHHVLESARASGSAHAAWLDGWLVAAEASLFIAEGRPEAASEALGHLTEPMSPEAAVILRLAQVAAGMPGVRTARVTRSGYAPAALDTEVTAALVDAAHYVGLGDERTALAALERSLQLAEPEKLRRPFAETVPSVRHLLRGADRVAAGNRWLHMAGDAGEHQPREAVKPAAPLVVSTVGAGPLIVDPLTSKELEVLGHLAELLSTEEIAATMFISVNTVRTHVRNILRKLDASKRNDAVRRAWDLGLLAVDGERTPAGH